MDYRISVLFVNKHPFGPFRLVFSSRPSSKWSELKKLVLSKAWRECRERSSFDFAKVTSARAWSWEFSSLSVYCAVDVLMCRFQFAVSVIGLRWFEMYMDAGEIGNDQGSDFTGKSKRLL